MERRSDGAPASAGQSVKSATAPAHQFSEETGPEATNEALLSVIACFRIPLARAKQIQGETQRAISGWRDEGQALGITHRNFEHLPSGTYGRG